MNKRAVHHITDTLGGDVICTALGVSSHMVRHARTTGQFPSSWYDPIFEMCNVVGIPCPRSAFKWKQLANNLSIYDGKSKLKVGDSLPSAAKRGNN